MSIINVYDVCEFIKDNSFEQIKELCDKNNICIKSGDNSNLYLLANLNDNYIQKKKVDTSVMDTIVDTSVMDTSVLIDNLDDIKKQANGIIIEKDTNKIVAMCQNKLQDLNIEQVHKLIEEHQDNTLRIEYCEDGTTMRLYNYNGTWVTATTRCIDAKKSFWSSSKDFDSMFWEIFDKSLLNSLDENYTYVFTLLHKENRIVVKHNVNMLVYISRINNFTWEEDYTNQFYNVYGIRRPKKVETQEFLTSSMQIYNPYKRGVLIKVLDNNTNMWNVYKVDFEKYNTIKTIRGNTPELRMRYLEILNDQQALLQFEKFYGENRFMFNCIKSNVHNLVREVHKLYIDSHIKHTTQVNDDNIYWRTLRQLHAQYKVSNKPITFVDVQNKITSLDKNVIKKLLNWS